MASNKEPDEISMAYDKLGGIIWIIAGFAVISVFFCLVYSGAKHATDRILMATLATTLFWPVPIYGIVIIIKNRKGNITKILLKDTKLLFQTKPGKRKLLRGIGIMATVVGSLYLVYRGSIFFDPFFRDVEPQIKAKVLSINKNDHAVIGFNYDGKYYIRQISGKKSIFIPKSEKASHYISRQSDEAYLCIPDDNADKAYLEHPGHLCSKIPITAVLMSIGSILLLIKLATYVFEKR